MHGVVAKPNGGYLIRYEVDTGAGVGGAPIWLINPDIVLNSMSEEIKSSLGRLGTPIKFSKMLVGIHIGSEGRGAT